MGKRARLAAFFVPAILATIPSQAAFHLMKIAEVFPGTQASPNAQYVVLQMYAAGQTVVNGHSVQVFDAAGSSIATFTFPSNVTNGANQSKILVGTTAAASFFGVAVDLSMTAVIPAAGGKVCFDSLDCVAWGNYSGSPTGVGTPFQATSGGLRLGRAAVRRLDVAGSPTVLEATDDTGNSANDFIFGTPAPRNNLNRSGMAPPSTCGNSALEGLEACDDGNAGAGDGCRSDCTGLEICGDLLVDSAVGETCDDGNTVGGDACPADCGVPTAAVPGESSASSELRATRGSGTTVDVVYAAACSAADHAVYWGVGPISGALSWSGSACGLGNSGNAAFDPGAPGPGQLLYFVVVGYTNDNEGSYGNNWAGSERPEATGVGACDRPLGTATCP
jgi:cysteine-rich repeat protein